MPATLTRRDIVMIVGGEDWDGNAVPRFLRPGYGVVLRGEFGKGFDIHGPHATMCRECGTPLFVDRGDRELITLQRHYSEAHGSTPALLP